MKRLNFWKDEGLERVVLAREVSMEEIKEMQKKWMSKLKHSSTVQCVFLIQDVGYYLTTWYIVMRTVVDVRNLVVGNTVYLIYAICW